MIIYEDHMTEDWSYDAENTAAHHRMNYILTHSHRKQLFKTVLIFHLFLVFLVSRRDFFQKHKKIVV